MRDNMGLRQRVVTEIYDEKDNKIVDREIINDKPIKKPESIEDLGYNHKEQIDLLQHIQDTFLFTQSTIMVAETCEKCGSKTQKAGDASSDFHAVYTDHKLMVPRRQCCNKDCGHRSYGTVQSIYGSAMHPDLVEKQAKTGSTKSFMESQISLEGECGKYRPVNNQLTVKRTIAKVGQILNKMHQDETIHEDVKEAKHLIIQADGGYIKSSDKYQGNFEVLVSHVYNPENHIPGTYRESGSRKSGVIEEKIYSASALKDRGKTIRKMTIAAAKKQGMTKNTNITALSDGAKNCWTVLKSLANECNKIEYILDWYHIKQKCTTVRSKLEDPYASELASIQWKIWHGEKEEAISRLSKLYLELINSDGADQLHELFNYLSNNKNYLVNYASRCKSKLPYTSSIIESTIETLVNTRHKKKHKAQWTREGAHNVLQIRTSLANKQWDNEWNEAKRDYYKKAA
jgi:hypothetical protein